MDEVFTQVGRSRGGGEPLAGGTGAAVVSEQLRARVPALAKLPREDLMALAAAARRRQYRRDEVIFHREDPGDSLHIIESGRVEILLPPGGGGGLILGILGPRG